MISILVRKMDVINWFFSFGNGFEMKMNRVETIQANRSKGEFEHVYGECDW